MVQRGKEKCAAHVSSWGNSLYSPLRLNSMSQLCFVILYVALPKEGVAAKLIVSTGKNSEKTSICKVYNFAHILTLLLFQCNKNSIFTVLSPLFRSGAGIKSVRVGPMSEKRPIHQHIVCLFVST